MYAVIQLAPSDNLDRITQHSRRRLVAHPANAVPSAFLGIRLPARGISVHGINHLIRQNTRLALYSVNTTDQHPPLRICAPVLVV